MNRIRHLVVALFGLALLGCGGGGGSDPRSSGFTYVTDWGSNAGAWSQVVSVYSTTNTLLNRISFSKTSGTSFPIGSIPNGQVRVHADLYNSSDESGSVVSSTDSLVQVTGSTTVQTSIGGAVNTVSVSPTTATVLVGQTVQYYATPKTASGQFIFCPAGSITWTVTGGVGSVGSDGIATGTTAGAGTVVATYVPSSITGSAAFNVTTNTPVHGKWTVMVFLNAANSLQQYAPLNVDQMEKVANNPDVRFVVQWKQLGNTTSYSGADWPGTRRYLVKADTTTGAINSTLIQDFGSTVVDMGDAQVLRSFVQWSMAKYPADHYALVLWDHGSGWRARVASGKPVRGISYDDQTGNNIDVWQLGRAYSNSSGVHQGALQGIHLDIVSFDACLMQMVEIANELTGVCDYVATSEENTPGPGYPYDRVFSGLAANSALDSLSVAKLFTDGSINNPSYQNLPVTQSVVATSGVAALNTAVDNLASAVLNNQPNASTVIGEVQAAVASHKFGDPGDGYNFYDLDDLAHQFMVANGASATVVNAAQAVRDAIPGAVLYSRNLNESWVKGISIDFSTKSQISGTNYTNLKFGTQNHWLQMLLAGP